MTERYYTNQFNNYNGVVLYEERITSSNKILPSFVIDVYSSVLFSFLALFIIAFPALFFIKKRTKAYYISLTVVFAFIEVLALGIVYQIAKFGVAKAFLSQAWILPSIGAFVIIIFINAVFVFSWYSKKESGK